MSPTQSLPTPPRLLFVVSEDHYFLSHRLHLALAAREAGYEVHVATSPGQRTGEITAHDLIWHPWSLSRRSLNPVREAGSLAGLVKIFRRVRPDLAHLVAVKPILYGVMAARLTGIPAVLAVAGLGWLYVDQSASKGGRVLRLFAESVYRLLVRGRRDRLVILQNADDEALMVARGLVLPEQVRRIAGAGVDLERFAPKLEPPGPPDAPLVVLCHSRMLWDKGIGELAAAAELLHARNVPVKVLLAGAPDEHNPASVPLAWLEGLAARPNIQWLGRRADIPELLAGCHVACLASYYREGIPLSLIEAAAAGKPIVTCDVPGCREVVADEDNGLLVEPRNPEALARALARLAKDSRLRRAMGERSREMAETRFGREAVAQAHLQCWAELLEERS